MFGVPPSGGFWVTKGQLKMELRTLALNTDHLLDLGHYLDEVGLGSHDFLDVFVGTGDLVDDGFVLAAFDALGLGFEIVAGEACFCLGSRHFTTRSM